MIDQHCWILDPHEAHVWVMEPENLTVFCIGEDQSLPFMYCDQGYAHEAHIWEDIFGEGYGPAQILSFECPGRVKLS